MKSFNTGDLVVHGCVPDWIMIILEHYMKDQIHCVRTYNMNINQFETYYLATLVSYFNEI